MKTTNLEHVNIGRLATLVIFEDYDVRPDIEPKVKKGIHDTEVLVAEMLSQDALPHIIRINDAAEMLGVSGKEMKKEIKHAMKIAYENSGAKYWRPVEISPEQIVYLTMGLTITQAGRFAEDIDEMVVRTNIWEFFDVFAIEDEYDISCFIFLIDYLETCLKLGKKSITKFLKEHSSKFVTNTRIMNYLRKNDWYGYIDRVRDRFGVESSSPKLGELMDAAYERMLAIKESEEAANEEFEIDKAFDKAFSK